jgi:hypothetical protein
MIAPWICGFICIVIAMVFFHHKLFLEDSSHSIQSFAKESNMIGQVFSILLASAFICGAIFFFFLPVCFAKQDAYEIEFDSKTQQVRVRKLKSLLTKLLLQRRKSEIEMDQTFPLSSFRGTFVSIQKNVILPSDDENDECKFEWQCHYVKPDGSLEIIVLDYILCSSKSYEVRALQSLNQKVTRHWQNQTLLNLI